MQSSQASLPQETLQATVTQTAWSPPHQVTWTPFVDFSAAHVHTMVEQTKIYIRQGLVDLLHLENERFAEHAITLTIGLMQLSMSSTRPLAATFFDDFFEGILVQNNEHKEKGGLALKLEVKHGVALNDETIKVILESLARKNSWMKMNEASSPQKRRKIDHLKPETVDRQLRLVYLLFHLVRAVFHKSGYRVGSVDLIVVNDCFGFVHKLTQAFQEEHKLYVFLLKLACVSASMGKYSSEEFSVFGTIWEFRNSGSHLEFILKICSLYQDQLTRSRSADPHQEILGPLLVDVWEMFCGTAGNRSLVQSMSIRRWKEENWSPEERSESTYYKFIRTLAATAVSECACHVHTKERQLEGTVDFLNDHINRQKSTEVVPGSSSLPIELDLDDDEDHQKGANNVQPSVDGEASEIASTIIKTKAPRDKDTNPANEKSKVYSGNIDREDEAATEPRNSLINSDEDTEDEPTPPNNDEDETATELRNSLINSDEDTEDEPTPPNNDEDETATELRKSPMNSDADTEDEPTSPNNDEDETATEPRKSLINSEEDSEDRSTPSNNDEDTDHEGTLRADVSLASSEDTGLLTQEPMDEFKSDRAARAVVRTRKEKHAEEESETSKEADLGNSILQIEINLGEGDDGQKGSDNVQKRDPSQGCNNQINGESNDGENLDEEEEYDEDYYMELMNRAMEKGFQEG